MVVEKMLDGQGSSRQGIGREAFTEQVWKWKKEYGGFISQQLRSLGASCDWSRECFTLDSQLSGAHSCMVLLPEIVSCFSLKAAWFSHPMLLQMVACGWH